MKIPERPRAGPDQHAMRQTTLTLSEIGLIAVTRGLLGAGAALLLGSQAGEKKRRALGWSLFAAGAASTIPLAMMVMRHREPVPARARVKPTASPAIKT